jgi:hypothetical protein
MPMTLSIMTLHGMPTYEIIMATKTMEKHSGKQDNSVKIISWPIFSQIVGEKNSALWNKGCVTAWPCNLH